MMARFDLILKSVIASTLFLYSFGLITAWSYPCVGYESSIYTSTPVVFWIANLSCFIVGVTSILYSMSKKEGEYSVFVAFGWSLLVLFLISITGLFILRGYGVLNISGDTGTHYGVLQTLLEAGVTTSSYPGGYIETIVLHLFSGVQLSSLINLNSILFVFLFLIGGYLLSNVICMSCLEKFFVMILCFLLPFGCTFYTTGGFSLSMYIPYLSAFLLCPLFLYLVFLIENNGKKFIFLILLILIGIISYHVLIYFVCVAFIGVHLVTFLMFKAGCVNHFTVVKSLVCLLALCFVAFFSWSYYLNLIQGRISTFSDFILDNIASDIYGETLSKTVATDYFGSLGIWEIGELILRQGGLLILLGIFFILVIPKLIQNVKSGRYHNLSVIYVFAIVILLIISLSFFIYSGFQPGRLVLFVSLCSIFSAGIVLSSLYQNIHIPSTKWKRIVRSGVLVISLTLIVGASIGSYYPSIHTVVTTPAQVTDSTLDGVEFYLQNSNYAYNELGIVGPLWRYSQYLSSSTYARHEGMDKNIRTISYPMDHFGYSSGILLGGNYTDSIYLLLMNSYLTNYNENPLWKYKVPPFTYGDVSRLNSDRTVSKIYDNPEFTISLISPYNEW